MEWSCSNVYWWLKEIELQSEIDIFYEKPEYIDREGWDEGVDYILNKLK
jgi:hypothetical protein